MDDADPRVIFVNRFYAPDESATSQLLGDLATHLAARGWRVRVVASRLLHDDPEARLAPDDTRDGVTVRRIRTTRFRRGGLAGRAVDDLFFYLAAAWTLWRLIRPGDIVVAKTDPPLLPIVAALVARARGARLVNWLQDIFPDVAMALMPSGLVRTLCGLLTPVRDAALRAAVLNVVLGERMAAFVARCGVDPSRIAVIGNWADATALRPLDPSRNPLRASWGLVDRFVVGYSGNMGRAHEFGTLLDAAERLRHDPGMAFVLIGGGYAKRWIAEEVRRRDLVNVLIHPYQPRDRLALSLAVPDAHLISLQPALEGLIVPSKLYGIAAVGRPTLFIGDPQGEVACFVRAAACGVALRIGDVDGLVEVIGQLRASRDLADQWGRGARAALEARHDKSIALAQWQAALAAVAAAGQGLPVCDGDGGLAWRPAVLKD